ncbi:MULTISPECIES: acetyl-CoA carboxylase biotin carboxyl carrier protein subunit [Bacillus]|uniref:Acetyl-CoA carboxylase biotin carboxyl carrier protein subunit n=1 Tax=Bacillus safensis TaxID=561879 RepID=A0AC61YQ48_BACIA|nr:acetyl-CoA carboxylase biotin carboxyl carrier protein subunit [Bacillus safensis]MBG9815494.1 acetyl-CoA carboxylase [Bacillus safensis]MDI0272582.1 acetyl-CoA carboxylase biotin carboxyl carrier protein subunit [Bacillus safensis]OYN65937.1 acetyl-CoA carboxylase biotin carboxyl carrier protein subunit [Bacillus safensis]UQZ93118.1 acetyl-CoA carboxylase biotin carboxyl carrier protein subunit [Bacillus safensis]USD84581.1 acetyl-CoA carboxylase biotin carboxyl carrier protein subunit [Ba
MKTVTIQMAGNLWKLLVKQGDEVQKGQEVAILESMKMEIPIVAEETGIISKVYKAEGEFVDEGEVLLELTE